MKLRSSPSAVTASWDDFVWPARRSCYRGAIEVGDHRSHGRVARLAPPFLFVIFQNSGHAPPLEEPTRFNDELLPRSRDRKLIAGK